MLAKRIRLRFFVHLYKKESKNVAFSSYRYLEIEALPTPTDTKNSRVDLGQASVPFRTLVEFDNTG